VSLIWAFSFGLIKTNLTNLDPNFVSFLRLSISLIIFLPFLRISKVDKRSLILLILIGAVQFGIMYISYIFAYQFLKAYEIALFTIFTPIYVTIFNDLIRKRFNKLLLILSIVAVLGAAIIIYKNVNSENFLMGFLLVQISNLCFAFGQVLYSKVMNKMNNIGHSAIFGLLYFGAVIVTLISSLFTADFVNITISTEQLFTLIYLGVVSSGIAFYLWNIGATRVNKGTLAIFNNLKIPLAVAVSIVFFGEAGEPFKLMIGGVIILTALFFNESLFKKKWKS